MVVKDMNEQNPKEESKTKDPIWKHTRIGVPKYATPDDLWQDAIRYFEWCDGNPVDATISVTRYKKEKHGGHKEMKKQDQHENITRPYTFYGLCAFTGISAWSSFKSTYLSKEGFADVIYAIENIVASQQIDGAMAGVFKENLTSRLNGLADKQLQEVSAEIDLGTKQFNGFSFLPWTPGLQNSDNTQIASGEIEPEKKEPEPIYAEVVDFEEIPKEKIKV